MVQKTVPTRERLSQVLTYNPETGDVRWLKARGKNTSRHAGHLGSRGYRYITVDGVCHMVHRLAWLWVYDAWPVSDVDHVNGDRCDNRIGNLRIASRADNNANSHVRKASSSGVKGVRWHKGNRVWQARITHNYKEIHLGYFKDISMAKAAFDEAHIRIHGQFSRQGEAYGQENQATPQAQQAQGPQGLLTRV